MRMITADGPAALEQAGHVEKSDNGDLLNTPEAAINIGGLAGQGYRLDAVTDLDPTTEEDGTVTSLAVGDDVYFYAVPSGVGDGRANLVASKNATTPDGFTAATSRKFSGFHFGRTRPLDDAHAHVKTYTPAEEIVWNSVWDLLNRPSAPPEGMVRLPSGWWVTIYLLSVGSGSGANVVPVSRYNATPIKDDVYARRDLGIIAGRGGYVLPWAGLFDEYAEGAPEGEDAANDTAWADTSNSGPATTGAVAKAVSSHNVVDAVGNLWDWLDNQHNTGTNYSDDRTVVEVGMYSADLRGEVYHDNWRSAIGGGDFDDGSRGGAGCVYWNAKPWVANGYVGVRGASGPLRARSA
ncbi:hypothetical protein SAMN05660831_02101 [Thiohalospira halophila DSM 15071]|uniref:Major tropism determinant second domain-containing protein n=1 Tax=Thiohalospira halophila DSM 15071 TaxID=1123397 RepID=A0A1I1UBR5_9GAMM|nr:hypothetical protein [Thiohalospira halophila]SFD68272.1 hypothetical protein SAMN05660831_02101 [Thiohalospira halophila DSM 15071]